MDCLTTFNYNAESGVDPSLILRCLFFSLVLVEILFFSFCMHSLFRSSVSGSGSERSFKSASEKSASEKSGRSGSERSDKSASEKSGSDEDSAPKGKRRIVSESGSESEGAVTTKKRRILDSDSEGYFFSFLF